MYSYENDKILRYVQEYETDIDFEYQQVGGLDIAGSEEEMQEIIDTYYIQKNVGDNEIILMDKKELLYIMPELNPDLVFGARVRPSDGNLAPFKMCHAFAQAASKYGARFRNYTTVKKIVGEGDRVKGVETDDGFIASKWVLNATNAWARLLTKECDAVLPMRVFECITELTPQGYKFPWEGPVGVDYIYGSRQKNGGMIIGGPAIPYENHRKEDDYMGYYQERLLLDDMKKLGYFMTELFPALKDTKVIRAWAGTMAFAPDGAPLCGPSEETEGLVHCVSFYGGMANGGIFGRTAAECIYQGEPTFPIIPFKPGRFKGTEYDGPRPWDLTVVYDDATKKNKESGYVPDYEMIKQINKNIDIDTLFKESVEPHIEFASDYDWKSKYGADVAEED